MYRKTALLQLVVLIVTLACHPLFAFGVQATPQQQGEPGPSQAAPATIMDQSLLALNDQPSLIDRLNARYNSAVAECEHGAPALHCSGILLRRATHNPGYAFWTHSPASQALGSVTFSWLRVDGASNSNDLTSGFIFMDNTTAMSAGYTLQSPRCIYPFLAGTQNNGRSLHGCGMRDVAEPPRKDESVCATQIPPAITVTSWSAHFKAKEFARGDQCSLSTQVPEQLITSLQARVAHADIAKTAGNELLIPTWDDTQPKQLPIEAFFFNANRSGAFETALELRNAFLQETSRDVPIVALDPGATDNQIFKAPPHDQQGRATAQALTLRYTSTASRCDGRTSLFCNGVILRTTTFSPQFKVWNPSQRSVNSGSVSFSYLRADLGIKALAWNTLYQGLIVRELDAGAAPDLYPLKPLCMYATDAASWDRQESGCGAHRNYSQASVRCAAQGIFDLATLKAHFQSIAGNDKHFNDRNQHQCSLAVDAVAFDISLKSREAMLNPEQYLHHNELLIETWPQNIPQLLPLEAFFYQSGHLDAITQAKAMQQDLSDSAAGLWKPVIRVDLQAGPEQVFTYRPEDQS